QPQRGDAEVLQVVELLGQPGEVADAVVVAVGERLDVQLVDDRRLVPGLVGVGLRLDGGARHEVHDCTRQARTSAGSCCGSMRSRTPPHSTGWRSPLATFSTATTRLRAPGGPTSSSPKWNQNCRAPRAGASATA